MTMEDFCKSLPKVELHAHLNGSLSCATIEKLLAYHKKHWPEEDMPEGTDTMIEGGRKGTFDDPFQMFGLIHRITDNTWAAYEATRDVIRDFAEDNVVYLELRTTPRKIEGRMSKEEYCDKVIQAIKDARLECPSIVVKLLLAIDRRRLSELEENLALFAACRARHPDMVVGLDVSGDPRVGDITTLLPRFTELREKLGVRFAVHLAEVPAPTEVAAFLKFVPERIGHGTCIHPELGGSQECWQLLQNIRDKSAVEVCLSSNVICGAVASYKEHQTGHFYKAKVPFVVCTDDKGVFCCSLSGEFNIAATNFGWTRKETFEIARSAVDHTFASTAEKEQLLEQFDKWRSNRSDV